MARLPLETVRVLDGPQDVTPRQTARGTTFIYCQAGSLSPIVSGHGEAAFEIPLDAQSTCAIICSFNIHVNDHGEDPADMRFGVLIGGGTGNQQDNFFSWATEYPDSPAAYYNATVNEVVTREELLDLTITCDYLPSVSQVSYHCTVIVGISTDAGCVEYSNPV